MTGQDKKKALITMGAAIGSLCLLAACNSGSGASGYSGGTSYYQQPGTDSNYPSNNYANSLNWENQAQQNRDAANQNEENINDSNGVSSEVDSGTDG